MMTHRLLIAALFILAATAATAEPFIPLDRARARALTDPAAHTTPAIVSFWSYDCVYCKKNLSLFAAMAKAEPRLRLITVAVEPPSPELAEPLDRLAIPGQRYAYGPESPEALAYALDPKWRGEVPRTLFFDGRGGRTAASGIVTEEAARQKLGMAAR